MLLLARCFTLLGDALINPKVTLPWILSSLGAPAVFSGWLSPLRESGSLLPQVFIAAWVRRYTLRRGLWILGSLLQAACVIALLVIVLLLEGAQAGWAMLLTMVTFSLARGLCSVISKDVVGKVIPVERRGSLNGWSASLAGFMTLLLAFLLWFLPASQSVYLTGLGLAIACWVLAAVIFHQVDEPVGEADQTDTRLSTLFRPLSFIWRDALLRRFVLARTLLLCSALSTPFYVMLAQQLDSSGGLTLLALLMAGSGLASLLSGYLWGELANNSSRRVMMIATLLVSVTGLFLGVVSWLHHTWLSVGWFVPLLYFVVCLAHEGVRTGRKTYLVNMATGNRRTDYVSASNSWIGLMLLLVGSVGGLVGWIGLEGVIVVLSFLGLAGVAVSWTLPEVEAG
ncbi:MFS transporter [Oceanobacter mangrovi]|uniref:MFS transporter n=1 Tax=Oceanobacter mangrovi TaxID=2862510 RepID=UPI001C8D7B99|nr:MFS transporter [Oceanobacter mangrovi]